jgi:succinyl-diaminopimelate desuccinylase
VGFKEAAHRLDQLSDDCVDFLARICVVPAIGPENHGLGEMAKYRIIRDAALALGPELVVELNAPDERVPDGVRPNLIALFPGRERARTLWILTHMDVVPEGERKLWDHDPFSPRVHDGCLLGRGVEDNGQALSASMFAVRAAKETCGLALNVGLAWVSDEESGSRFGLDYVLQHRSDLFKPTDLILVPDAGSKDGDHIIIAEKHLLQVRFQVNGKQGHASRPDLSRNSLRAAAYFITELDRALPALFPDDNPFFNPAASTFEPTRKDANVPNVNTIPAEDVFYFDCRVLPDADLDRVLMEMKAVGSDIARRFGVRISVEESIKFEAPAATSPDAPVVIAVAQAVQEVYGVQARPVGIGGQTVAAFFRKRGLPAATWQKTLDLAHAPNERIRIDDLLGNAKVFARLMV